MRLHDELDLLARAAATSTDVDRIMRIARRRRASRLTAAPAVAVIVVLALIFGLRWWPLHAEVVASTGRTYLSFSIATSETPEPAVVQRTAQMLLDRAVAAGLAGPSITVEKGTIVLSVSVRPRADVLRRLTAPGAFQIRRLLAAQNAAGGSTTAPESAADVTPSLADVRAKLGDAYEVAGSIQDPDQVDAGTLARLAPFGTLSGTEVATLPATMQYNVPTVSCAQLDQRPYLNDGLPADQQVTACGSENGVPFKYRLDVATVTREGVSHVTADNQLGTNGSHVWGVNIGFTTAAQARWTALTEQLYAAHVRDGHDARAALVVDDEVVSAPTINGAILGDAVVTNDFSEAASVALAARLNGGPLPLPLKPPVIRVRPR